MNYFKANFFKAYYFAANYLAGAGGAAVTAHFRHFFSTMGLMGAFIEMAGPGGGGGDNWILATGFWNDSGVWIDGDSWID